MFYLPEKRESCNILMSLISFDCSMYIFDFEIFLINVENEITLLNLKKVCNLRECSTNVTKYQVSWVCLCKAAYQIK